MALLPLGSQTTAYGRGSEATASPCARLGFLQAVNMQQAAMLSSVHGNRTLLTVPSSRRIPQAGLSPIMPALSGQHCQQACLAPSQRLGTMRSQSTRSSLHASSVAALASSADALGASDAESGDWAAEIDELMKLLDLLPPAVRGALETHPDMVDLLVSWLSLEKGEQ